MDNLAQTAKDYENIFDICSYWFSDFSSFEKQDEKRFLIFKVVRNLAFYHQNIDVNTQNKKHYDQKALTKNKDFDDEISYKNLLHTKNKDLFP